MTNKHSLCQTYLRNVETASPDVIQKKDLLKPFVYLVTFLALTPLTVAISFFALFSLSAQKETLAYDTGSSLIEVPKFGVQVYAALPQQQRTFSSSTTSADARVEIVRQYLEKYNSPLEPLSELIIVISDEYQLDFRLLVAIAQQESNLCKKIPEGTFNCWGWGIHSRGTLGFTDYPTAIQTVAKGLKEDYINEGYVTPEEIMSKYTPHSSGSWAAGVTQFLEEME